MNKIADIFHYFLRNATIDKVFVGSNMIKTLNTNYKKAKEENKIFTTILDKQTSN